MRRERAHLVAFRSAGLRVRAAPFAGPVLVPDDNDAVRSVPAVDGEPDDRSS